MGKTALITGVTAQNVACLEDVLLKNAIRCMEGSSARLGA